MMQYHTGKLVFRLGLQKLLIPMLSPLHGQHVTARFHSRVNHNVRAINGPANTKVSGLEQIYLKYQTRASTARELLYFYNPFVLGET